MTNPLRIDLCHKYPIDQLVHRLVCALVVVPVNYPWTWWSTALCHFKNLACIMDTRNIYTHYIEIMWHLCKDILAGRIQHCVNFAESYNELGIRYILWSSSWIMEYFLSQKCVFRCIVWTAVKWNICSCEFRCFLTSDWSNSFLAFTEKLLLALS